MSLSSLLLVKGLVYNYNDKMLQTGYEKDLLSRAKGCPLTPHSSLEGEGRSVE
jgi:hypothetical protein